MFWCVFFNIVGVDIMIAGNYAGWNIFSVIDYDSSNSLALDHGTRILFAPQTYYESRFRRGEAVPAAQFLSYSAPQRH
jgi:hypothetical protein